MSFTREQIEMAMKKLGHAYFENGEHNINIIGIRNSSTGKRVTNAFDDWMTLSYKETVFGSFTFGLAPWITEMARLVW